MNAKTTSQDSHYFSVQLGLLLLKKEASRNCSNFCLRILENFLLLASDSNLSLFIHWVVFFVPGASLTFSGFLLFLQITLFAGLSLLGSFPFISSHLRHGISPRTRESLWVFPWGRLLVFLYVAFQNSSLLPSYGCAFSVSLSIF